MSVDTSVIDTHVGLAPDEKLFYKRIIQAILAGSGGVAFDTRTGGLQLANAPAGEVLWDVSGYQCLKILNATDVVTLAPTGTPLVGVPYFLIIVNDETGHDVDGTVGFVDYFFMNGLPSHVYTRELFYDGTAWYTAGNG